MQRWDNLYKLIGRHMPQELCHIYFRDIEWVKSSGKWYKKREGGTKFWRSRGMVAIGFVFFVGNE